VSYDAGTGRHIDRRCRARWEVLKGSTAGIPNPDEVQTILYIFATNTGAISKLNRIKEFNHAVSVAFAIGRRAY
jgi:hypothetical protein